VESISGRDAQTLKLLKTSGIWPGVRLRVRDLRKDEGYSVSIGNSPEVFELSRNAADAIRIDPKR
jgi:hypothetical protein